MTPAILALKAKQLAVGTFTLDPTPAKETEVSIVFSLTAFRIF